MSLGSPRRQSIAMVSGIQTDFVSPTTGNINSNMSTRRASMSPFSAITSNTTSPTNGGGSVTGSSIKKFIKKEPSKMDEFLEARRPRRASCVFQKPITPTNISISPKLSSLAEDSFSEPVYGVDTSEFTFSYSEINSFVTSLGSLMKLKNLFFLQTLEPLLAFCSILTRGKETSSPSKKRRRAAYVDIFAKLNGFSASFIYVNKIDIEEISISLNDLAIGLTSLSTSMNNFSTDEIYSLALLIDVDCKGSISWTDFYDFAQGVEESLRVDPTQPKKCFALLYSDLRLISNDLINQSKTNADTDDEVLLNKLSKFGKHIRLNLKMFPLQLLCLLELENKVGPDFSSNSLVELFQSFGANLTYGNDNYNSTTTTYQDHSISIPSPSSISSSAKNFEEPIIDLNASIKQLRENAAIISSKLSSQEEDMDSTLGLWNAIQSIELGILQQTSEYVENKIKEDLTVETSQISPSNKPKPNYMTSMFGKIEDDEELVVIDSPSNNNNNNNQFKIINLVPDFSSKEKENTSIQTCNISTNSITNKNQDNSSLISNIEAGKWESKIMTKRASLSGDRLLMTEMMTKKVSPQNINKSKKKVI